MLAQDAAAYIGTLHTISPTSSRLFPENKH